MGLCSWSLICINVPGKRESRWIVLWRKIALSALGIMCPEIQLSMGASQWVGARQCVKDFATLNAKPGPVDDPENQSTTNPLASNPEKEKAKEVIDMPKAFYIDMGGFRVKPKDGDCFPVNGKEMYWLVKKGWVQQPLFKRSMVEDKNKVDPMLRVITLLQISYFLVGVIGRWAQHLFVTTAELTTASFIFCSVLSAGFWWHKPCDVVAPENIELDKTLDEIAKEAPLDRKWQLTPLDFVSRDEWWWSKVWWNYLNILRRIGICFGSEASDDGTIDRIADSVQRPLPRLQQYMMLAVTAGCFAIFFLAWDHAFPTPIERTIWRIVCILLMGTMGFGLAISEAAQAYEAVKKPMSDWSWRLSRAVPLTQQSERPKPTRFFRMARYPRAQEVLERIDRYCDGIRNNSRNGDPDLKLPLKIILPLYVLGFVYMFSRSYILIADAIGLRLQPPSAYSSVDWQKFWPHFG
ncbi:MAG: hypothetical protein L6R35_003607 [Caloplaca aegaea]|nr:MAG: hypothetical protein L6R35_003607 [Caloplaca aegaea]